MPTPVSEKELSLVHTSDRDGDGDGIGDRDRSTKFHTNLAFSYVPSLFHRVCMELPPPPPHGGYSLYSDDRDDRRIF